MNIRPTISPRPTTGVRSGSQQITGHDAAENTLNTAQSSSHNQQSITKRSESATGPEKTQPTQPIPNAAEIQQLEKLKSRDREVRAHEAAHKATAGPYSVGAPSYQLVTGPDGKQYAVGGEVQIDTAEIPNDPRATLVKAQTIRRAANAPLHPSSQDHRVATQAGRMESKARQELAEQRSEQDAVNTYQNNLATSQEQPENRPELHMLA